MTLLQSQQEKARAELHAHLNISDENRLWMDDFLDRTIASTVTAVLDGVREVMPEEKNYTDKFAACWNCGKYNYSCECESAYNECRTALLKSLEEMEGKGV